MEYDLEKISSKIGRRNAIKKFFKKILTFILIIVAIINITLLYYTLNGEKNPSIFGIRFFNIVSGSMTPNIEINDVILVKKCDIRDLKKDDIITFTKDKKTISHRIVKIIENENSRMFITKGDNNDVLDDGLIKENQIIGKVVFTIPKIGELIMYIQDKNGFINIISLIVIAFILICMKDEKKNRRKKIRKKYELKKEREKYN